MPVRLLFFLFLKIVEEDTFGTVYHRALSGRSHAGLGAVPEDALPGLIHPDSIVSRGGACHSEPKVPGASSILTSARELVVFSMLKVFGFDSKSQRGALEALQAQWRTGHGSGPLPAAAHPRAAAPLPLPTLMCFEVIYWTHWECSSAGTYIFFFISLSVVILHQEKNEKNLIHY